MAEFEGGGNRLAGRRQFLAGLVVLPLGLAGCQFVKSEPVPTTTPAAGAFPVTISHAFGATVIPSEPLRVATMGFASNDICLALGVVPLAMPLSEAQPNGSTPWFDFAWKKFGVELPLLLDESKGLPLDDLRGMGPDLILAVNSELTRAEYEELSKIAPVVPSPKEFGVIDWRSSLALVGAALGRTEEADKVRVSTEASIVRELQNYPDLQGTSFVVVKVRSAAGADLKVMGAESNAVRLLEEWGLTTSPSLSVVREQGQPLGTARVPDEGFSWPQGRAPELDSEIAIISILHRELAEVTGSMAHGTIPAFLNGTYLIADSRDGALALDTGSCLSVQWLSRTMLPEIAKSAFLAKRGD